MYVYVSIYKYICLSLSLYIYIYMNTHYDTLARPPKRETAFPERPIESCNVNMETLKAEAFRTVVQR